MVLQQLLTFCRVVEEGGVTRAARSLNLTQPTVSKQIRQLEEACGLPLLVRRGRGIRLTPAGEVLYTYARRIVATVKECESVLQSMATPGRGHVHVGCVTTVGLFTLPEILAEFRRLYPEVRLQVRTGQIQETVDRVLHGEVDVGLITVPVSHPEVVCEPLFEDEVVLVASPGQAQALPDPLPLPMLGVLEMIGYQAPSRFRSYVDGVLAQHGIHLRLVMEFDSHEAVKTMVGLGFGAAFVPRSAVRRELQEGTLVVLRVQDLPRIQRTTSLILPRRARLSPAVARFVAVVRARYARGEAEEERRDGHGRGAEKEESS